MREKNKEPLGLQWQGRWEDNTETNDFYNYTQFISYFCQQSLLNYRKNLTDKFSYNFQLVISDW